MFIKNTDRFLKSVGVFLFNILGFVNFFFVKSKNNIVLSNVFHRIKKHINIGITSERR